MRARITAKPKAAPKLTDMQRLLVAQLEGLPMFRDGALVVELEARVCAERRWRMDVSVKERRGRFGVETEMAPYLAIEIDGGGFIPNGGGRHSRGAGIEKDCEKVAAIAAQGYRFLRVTPKQVRNGLALKWIERCL